jgi:hypothetical protein
MSHYLCIILIFVSKSMEVHSFRCMFASSHGTEYENIFKRAKRSTTTCIYHTAQHAQDFGNAASLQAVITCPSCISNVLH